MKVEIINDLEYKIYVIKEYLDYKNDSEKFLTNVFEEANLYYDIDNNGYIKIKMYIDPIYGVVLECLISEEKYYSYKLNIELEEIKTNFLIETNEKNGQVINNKNYIKPNKLTDFELGKIYYKL